MTQAVPPPLPQPQPQRDYASPGYQSPPSNGLGLAGFIVSLVGLVITGGLLCPVGALISGIALFKPPRGFAIAGVVLGVIGTGVGVMLVMMMVWIYNSAGGAWSSIQSSGTTMMAEFEIDAHYSQHGQLPDDATGTQLVAQHIDPWGQPLTYRKVSATDYEFISSGPDGQANTSDDIVSSHFAIAHAALHGGSIHSSDNNDATFLLAESALRARFSGQVPPTQQQAMTVVSGFKDHSGNEMRYKVTFDDRFLLIFPGPDGQYETSDDESYIGSMATE